MSYALTYQINNHWWLSFQKSSQKLIVVKNMLKENTEMPSKKLENDKPVKVFSQDTWENTFFI